jgi:hypothetical protein
MQGHQPADSCPDSHRPGLLTVVRAVSHCPPNPRPASVDHQQPGRGWMFQCHHCGTVTPPRVSAETIVAKTRPRVNPPRRKAHREIVWKKPLQHFEKQDDPGGTG